MNAVKWVYRFGAGVAEGDADMCAILGNKGANLAEMAAMGLPVPPGFIISTRACKDYLDSGHVLKPEIRRQVESALCWLEEVTNKKFGGEKSPLLVSVRSGAQVSMPGMMDTVLNLGLNDKTVKALIDNLTDSSGDDKSDEKCFILDCYRRLIQMYGYVVLGVDAYLFEDILHDFRNLHGIRSETHLNEAQLLEIIKKYQAQVQSENGSPYPQDLMEQFYEAVGAVFHSWYSPRAISYRAMNEIDDDSGTAVTIQAMVFGNMSENSASGVAFTRNPSDGNPIIYGEYLPKAQGEEIVAGFRTPRALTERGRLKRGDRTLSLQALMPEAYKQLLEVGRRLEARFLDMQDIEFTIEEGHLWLLQTRTGKRTTEAAIRIALDLLDEGVINEEQARAKVAMQEFDRLLRPVIDPSHEADFIVSGLPASPGAASGEIVFTSRDAVEKAAAGVSVILVRNETNPEDVEGINAASALLTRRGGMTSHAAVIARAMGRPCVVGASSIRLEPARNCMSVMDRLIHKGYVITIDGAGGRVLAGRTPMKAPELSPYAQRFKALVQGA